MHKANIKTLTNANPEHIIDSDLNSNTSGNYLKETFLTANLSTKVTAINNLINVKYPKSSMLENNTNLLSLQRDLQVAFKNESSISIEFLVSIFALVNLPMNYHATISFNHWHGRKYHNKHPQQQFKEWKKKHRPNIVNTTRLKTALVSTIRFNADSGATDTIVSNKAGLQSYASITHPIKIANGESIYATEIGKLQSSTYDRNRVLYSSYI
ncbi:hypothetical protein ROZALSC1DRAFT_25828 [Rozella allomycis CSF55]|uniref:Uncharacterized protein n=1 Tax=Rozella allomycis (strain CSF55) TaxID=988480 RepID=A0A4P9YAL2_ROZAC|nr:hypothetical protein ROZALSC1DRAFT_25828 [Rozella allomycis CSF55]